jgi:hypothetical protein
MPADKLTVAWGTRQARPYVGRFHRALYEQHGLVDVFSMAHALSHLNRRACTALERIGFDSLSLWLRRALGGLGRGITERVPDWIFREALGHHEQDLGPNVPDHLVCFPYSLPTFLLRDLELLDRQKGLSPRLWVVRREHQLPAAVRASCARLQEVRIWVGGHSATVRPPAGAGMLSGVGPEESRWWAAESWAAATRLCVLSVAELAEALSSQSWVRPGNAETRTYWNLVWRKRKARLLKPVVVTGKSVDRSPGRVVPLSTGLLEFSGIPFYHVNQVRDLHTALLTSRVSFPLVGTLTDAHFKRAGIIATLRQERGFSRLETRGRPERDLALVQQVGNMVSEGLPKYQVAKRLGMKWPTVQDYWRAFLETQQPGD